MSFEIPGVPLVTRTAAADLTTHQFKFVKVDAAGKAALPSLGDLALGVLQNKPNTGEAATVMPYGVSKVVAGAAVTAGANVTADASGRAIAATTGQWINGIALETASGAGVVIAVALIRGGKV